MSVRRPTTSGGSAKKRLPETDRGTGPATSVSPAASASRPDEALSTLASTHLSEVSRQPPVSDERQDAPNPLISPDEGDGDELEIERAYRLRLQSARRLPARERQAALRAARHWVLVERKRLRDRRAAARNRQRLQRRIGRPAPMP